MNLSEYKYDQPGNQYFWMKYESDTDSTYLIWGSSEMEVEEEIVNLYNELVQMTKKSK